MHNDPVNSSGAPSAPLELTMASGLFSNMARNSTLPKTIVAPSAEVRSVPSLCGANLSRTSWVRVKPEVLLGCLQLISRHKMIGGISGRISAVLPPFRPGLLLQNLKGIVTERLEP